jgi:hypothetical protein
MFEAIIDVLSLLAKVFKVLWSEPQGNAGGRGDGSSDAETFTEGVNKYGEKSFQKVRRFVIIRPLSGHCICLSVQSSSILRSISC